MDWHRRVVAGHRPIEGHAEDRRAVAVRCEILVRVDLHVLDADELQLAVVRRRIQEDLGLQRVDGRVADESTVHVVNAHRSGRRRRSR